MTTILKPNLLDSKLSQCLTGQFLISLQSLAFVLKPNQDWKGHPCTSELVISSHPGMRAFSPTFSWNSPRTGSSSPSPPMQWLTVVQGVSPHVCTSLAAVVAYDFLSCPRGLGQHLWPIPLAHLGYHRHGSHVDGNIIYWEICFVKPAQGKDKIMIWKWIEKQ